MFIKPELSATVSPSCSTYSLRTHQTRAKTTTNGLYSKSSQRYWRGVARLLSPGAPVTVASSETSEQTPKQDSEQMRINPMEFTIMTQPKQKSGEEQEEVRLSTNEPNESTEMEDRKKIVWPRGSWRGVSRSH